MEGIIAVSIPIIITLGVFTWLLGMRALENKERMAMIERGMEPPISKPKNNPASTLRSALFFIGAGLGLLAAIMLNQLLPGLNEGAEKGIYFALIAIGAGSGLLAAFLYDKKMEKAEKDSYDV